MVSVSGVSARSFAHSSRVKCRYGESGGSAGGVTLSFTARVLRRARLFGEAGLARAAGEFGHDIVQGELVAAEQDEQVVEHVRGLVDRVRASGPQGRDDEFDRFLAEFLGRKRRSAVEQGARVGGGGTIASPGRHDRLKIFEPELRGHAHRAASECLPQPCAAWPHRQYIRRNERSRPRARPMRVPRSRRRPDGRGCRHHPMR